MSPALFLFELLKMSKLLENHWSCIFYLSIEAEKKIEAKIWGKKIQKHNFKIPRAHVYPQTTSKMPVKFQKHLLKAVGGVAHKVPTTIIMHFHSIEA